MTRSMLERSGTAAALLFVALPVAAHHSYAPYDLKRTVTLEGVVTKFLWANPHVYIDVRAGNQGNGAVAWIVESLATGKLRNLGWSASSLAVGDHVVVTAHPAKNPNQKLVFGSAVLKADGTLLQMPQVNDQTPVSANPAVPFVAKDLSGRWQVQFDPSVVSRFVAPLKLPLTDKGIAAVKSFDPNKDIPGKDCKPFTVPYMMLFTPGGVEIELGKDVTTIRAGGAGGSVARTIHMNLDSHDKAPFGYQGHSIGRWEGNALVVDTTRFSDHRSGNAFGLPSGSQKHLIERFELSADKTRLTYTFTLDDPEYLAEPVMAKLVLRYRPDLPFVSTPCNLESARRYLDFIGR
jgi:Family of unknown function (DUF6152)